MKFIPFTSYIISEGEKNCPLCGSENYQNISNWDRRFKKLKHVKDIKNIEDIFSA